MSNGGRGERERTVVVAWRKNMNRGIHEWGDYLCMVLVFDRGYWIVAGHLNWELRDLCWNCGWDHEICGVLTFYTFLYSDCILFDNVMIWTYSKASIRHLNNMYICAV